ncbi:hypothetical protein AAFF_G00228340 [Aldrovandia affinis]|uniref:PiggyBac transposable element-derived protein domain-containing protein n=1 Tax=Aldrovandia affinis TaxID=143900 RepID=A0AAD7SVI9_9TELE|nr:hypothetical protein AAFF_G00228340 [Aldrovandia affinis]
MTKDCVTDKLAAIWDIWDKWLERLPLMYNPGPEVTVEERLVPFRGHCPFCQNIPSKPVKLWDKDMGYACSSSEKKITMVGTVRRNKPELPSALIETRGREVFSSMFAFTSGTTVVSYIPKKNRNVILIHTFHKVPELQEENSPLALAIFHNIIDISTFNAFVIWRELNPTWRASKRNWRRLFLEDLEKAL